MPVIDPNEIRYEGARRAARDTVAALYLTRAAMGIVPQAAVDLSLTKIDDVALDAMDRQWTQPEFRWRAIQRQNRGYRRRFEVAMWVGNELEALCVGRASRGPDNVTLWFLERRPGVTRLKGFVSAIAFDTAEVYAQAIQRRRIKLKDPLPGPLPKYIALGFRLAETYRRVTYYDKVVP